MGEGVVESKFWTSLLASLSMSKVPSDCHIFDEEVGRIKVLK